MDKIAEVDEKAVGAIPYTGLIRFKMFEDSKVKKIILPDYLQEIGEWAFGGCANFLESVYKVTNFQK